MEIARLLGVWAHPDDEAYLSAGLMGRVADAGGLVACVTATRGELGGATGEHRERELRQSLAIAGAQAVDFLGYPDGGCAAVPHEEGVTAISAAIERFQPDAIVTFGPYGVTGHPDHIAVHRWTTAAWRRVETDAHLLYAVMAMPDQPLPDVALALQLDLEPHELDRKRAALAAHASQTETLANELGEAVYRAWVSRESFSAANRRSGYVYLSPPADPRTRNDKVA